MKEYEADPPGVRPPPTGKFTAEVTVKAIDDGPSPRLLSGEQRVIFQKTYSELELVGFADDFAAHGKGVVFRQGGKYRLTVEEITEESGK